MDRSPDKVFNNGTHSIEFYAPDFIRQVIVGTMTGPDARWIIDICKQLKAEHGDLWIVVNMSNGGGANGDARKILAEETPYVACALCGGNAVMRAVARVITLASAAFSSTAMNSDFFKTEEEGTRWLEGERAKHKAAKAS